MSPLITSFAGLSVLPLGFTRGSSDTYYIGQFSVLLGTGESSFTTSDNNTWVAFGGDTGGVGARYYLTSRTGTLLNSYSYLPNGSGTNVVGVHGLCTDSSNNLYFGSFSGAAAPLVVKMNSSNTLQWTTTFTAGAGGVDGRTASDSAGNVWYSNRVPATQFLNICRLNTSGSLLWQRSLQYSATGGASALQGGMVVDGSSNVYWSGTVNTATQAAFLVKYNSSGTIQWQRSLTVGTSTFSGSYGNNRTSMPIAIESGGANIYTIAHNYANPNTFTHITKVDANGSTIWQRRLSEATDGAMGNSITTDPAGNVYLSLNTFANTGNFAYLVKYSSSGTLLWQIRIQSNAGTRTTLGSVTASTSSVTVCGISGDRGFVLRQNSSTPITGTYTIGSVTYTISNASLTDAAGGFTYSASSYTDAAGGFTTSTTGGTTANATETITTRSLP